MVGVAVAGEVGFPSGGVVGVDEDVDLGGEAVFEGVFGGGGFARWGDGALRVGSVDAGLVGSLGFFDGCFQVRRFDGRDFGHNYPFRFEDTGWFGGD